MKGGGDSDSSDSAPEIAVGKAKGKGKGKEVVVVSNFESFDSESRLPFSLTGVRRGQVGPESSHSDS